MQPDSQTACHRTTVQPPYLVVLNEESQSTKFKLVEGVTAFAGSGKTCGILLGGEDVSHFHCMFCLNQGRLWVQDCETDGQTIVNGHPIKAEAVLSHGDHLTIGSNQIEVVLILDASATTGDDFYDDDVIESEVCEQSVEQLGRREDPEFDSIDTRHCSRNQSNVSTDSYDYEIARLNVDESSEANEVAMPSDSDEVNFLRSEVEHLQSELSERDAELTTFRTQQFSNSDSDCSEDNEDVVRLVNRLDELVEELQFSDQRHNDLAEFLRLSDEANQAEQEERRQLESWIQGIEQRVSQRAAESEAETARILVRNKDLQEQLNRAETYIRKVTQTASGNSSVPQAQNEMIQELRDRQDELTMRLTAANEENERLRQEFQEKNANHGDELRKLEQKIVELELDACRERAEISRQRADLERAKSELEKKLQETGPLSDSDCRFAAMRQHLRDLHEQEKLTLEEKRRRSLSGRIANLLNRVGSR